MSLSFFVGWLAEGIGSGFTFTENTAAGYTRKAVTLAPLSNGQTSLVFGVTFSGMTGTITVTQRALYDAPSGGNLLQFWSLASAITVLPGGTDTLASGSLNHTYPVLAPTPAGEAIFPAAIPLGLTASAQPIITGVSIAVTNGSLSVSPFATGAASATAAGTSGSVAQAMQGITGGIPVATSDANGAAFQGAVALTPGTPVAAQRSLGYICSAAGNVTLTLADGSSLTVPITTGAGAFQTLPFAVTNLGLGTGTAGTFWNLK